MSRVSEKILRDAAEKALQIAEEYRLKGETMRHMYEEGCSSKALENKMKTDALYEGELKRLLGAKRLEMRRRILAEKRVILKDLAVAAAEMIHKDSGIYRRFIERAVARGVATGGEEVVVSEDERYIFTDEFLEHLNKIAAEVTGAECRLRISYEAGKAGGILLREGCIVFNAAVSTSADEAAGEFEPELAAILFGMEIDEQSL